MKRLLYDTLPGEEIYIHQVRIIDYYSHENGIHVVIEEYDEDFNMVSKEKHTYKQDLEQKDVYTEMKRLEKAKARLDFLHFSAREVRAYQEIHTRDPELGYVHPKKLGLGELKALHELASIHEIRMKRYFR